MRWQQVESTVIAAAGYSSERKQLDIVFRTGHRYRYFLVPEDVFEALLAADSAGRFFQRKIRDRFPARKLER